MKELNRARFNVGIGWFVLMFCIGLLDLPFRYFLRDNLFLSASAIATFFAIVNIPIYSKPLLGFFLDIIKQRGTNTRNHIMLCLCCSCVLYMILGYVHTIKEALWYYLFLTVFLGMLSIIFGAMIVEYGKKHQNTGGLSSLRIAVIKIAIIISGPLGGYLAIKDIRITTTICATLMVILVPIFMFSFHEKRTSDSNSGIGNNIKFQFKNLIHSKVLLTTILLIFLWKIAPGFITPLWYHQTDTLHFSSSFIGLLSSLLAGGGILGAVIYGRICKRINLKTLLILGTIVDAIDSLFYLGYNGPVSAIIITSLNGVTAALCALPLYDLAARATPNKSESLGYALILSVWNFADAISDIFGTKLFDVYHLGFSDLVWINTISTIAILLFIPLIPKWVTQYTDQ